MLKNKSAHMHLLLVEDDLQLGTALSRSLKKYDFECTWVRRLKEAREQVGYALPSLLILDINLPDGEGFELLTELRAKKIPLPIVVMTARDALNDRLRGLNAGADDYIIKPFAVDELVARVRAVIRRAAGFASQVWSIGPIEVDPQTHTIKVNGTRVDLTRREFQILVELMRNAGRVLERDTLADRVWGHDQTPSNGALEFQIHSLRRKLGGEFIVTIRGVGYMLKA
jgi:two-component system, OmpR family, response regulator QseB